MIVFVLTTMALALVDDASLEWSNAVLIDPWTYTLPVPDGFHAFDERHFFGLGGPATATDLLWQFSADAGKTWRNTSTPGSVPHPDTPLLRTAPGVLQSLGGGLFQTDEHGWRIQNPKAYALLPDGSGFSITAAPGGGLSHFVNFTGVPAPGVNISGDAIIKSGTRNYGVWMCRCVDVWTCGYRCVDVWMCGRVGHVGRVDVWICRRVYEWMCGCADVYIRVRVRAFACACVRDRSTLPPNMHTRTHAHAHTHTCTRTRTPPSPLASTPASMLLNFRSVHTGMARAANGDWVLQSDILWNGEQIYSAHGTKFSMMSSVSFTSSDGGWSWKFGGIIANASDVHGNATDPAPGTSPSEQIFAISTVLSLGHAHMSRREVSPSHKWALK